VQTCSFEATASLPGSILFADSRFRVELRDLTPLELVRYCLSSRDGSAWNEFVGRFQPLIASVIIKTLRRGPCPNSSLIDDLIQETYVKLFAHDFKALREFDSRHEKAFFGFLRVVASNVVQDHFRSHYSQKRGSGKVEEDLELTHARTPSNHGAVDKAERRILLAQMKKRLKVHAGEVDFSRNYAIFQLYFEHGLTARAIADMPTIGLSTKGVESALGRLTRLLRETINGGQA
jgi:RNA polymerase sigma-70 factor, ECF subfamily